VLYRTNNNLEAYHSHLFRHFGGGSRGGAKPNAWMFLGILYIYVDTIL